ncbi:MAG: twitching motility protein PilT [Candidatus Omnitrophica bacterium]|nr:twitching motility protein PilT [Candidatus Omnitrophota bacterium]
MALWVLRISFMILCILGGYAISQVRPDLVDGGSLQGIAIGFGLGGLLLAIDEMLKGFSLRAFSAATFGLVLGSVIAWLIDRSQLFIYVDESTRWIIRLAMFVSFSYIGMVLAMRSNKEDFYLIIPFVRFASQNKSENLHLLDTSVIVDGRIADLFEMKFLEGVIVVPRFVLKELHQIADSQDPARRARGRRGLDTLSRLQRDSHNEVKIHEYDPTSETVVDAKLVRLAQILGARLYTNDYNLGRIAELQSVPFVNLSAMAQALKPVLLPGEILSLRIVREGRDKGQGIGYLGDGTMVVVNQAQSLVGQQVSVQVLNMLQTGAGVIVFADLKPEAAAL